MLELFRSFPLLRDLSDPAFLGIGLLIVLLFAILADFIAKHILLGLLRRLIERSKTTWDDALLRHRVFHRIAHLAPVIVVQYLAPGLLSDYATASLLLDKILVLATAFIGLSAIYSFLDAALDVYRNFEVSKNRPIKGYLQVLKIVLGVAIGIFAISTLMNRSPLVLLSGLGAMTAVLMLVFKDTILGFVASVQLAANDMIRMGDWISMPKYGADGDVIDLSLTTVKVQNWDKTITTIPTWALISESFKNWRGMSESGGRRIKRSISIDMNSVEFLSTEKIEEFRSFQFITDYVNAKEKELAEWNASQSVDDSQMVNGRRMTNIGTFRAYVEEYLRRHPLLHKGLTLMVRQLEPGEHGIPIQVYCFSNDQEWVNYEKIQADLFDHIMAVIPEFGLRVYQNPTGKDLSALVRD